jgi:hypothetical protein
MHSDTIIKQLSSLKWTATTFAKDILSYFDMNLWHHQVATSHRSQPVGIL